MSIISLAPREAATFPYGRFKSSPVLTYGVRRLNLIRLVLGTLHSKYLENSGMRPEIGETITFDQLFTYIDQLIEYMNLYRSLPDESTLNSIKITLEYLEDIIKHFEMHSVEPLRLFINRISRILGTYHRSIDITGYLVDISGTYNPDDTDIKEIEVFTDKSSAVALLNEEGDEDSRMYTVIANVVSKGTEGSREVISGLWLLETKDIFYCSVCAG